MHSSTVHWYGLIWTMHKTRPKLHSKQVPFGFQERNNHGFSTQANERAQAWAAEPLLSFLQSRLPYQRNFLAESLWGESLLNEIDANSPLLNSHAAARALAIKLGCLGKWQRPYHATGVYHGIHRSWMLLNNSSDMGGWWMCYNTELQRLLRLRYVEMRCVKSTGRLVANLLSFEQRIVLSYIACPEDVFRQRSQILLMAGMSGMSQYFGQISNFLPLPLYLQDHMTWISVLVFF